MAKKKKSHKIVPPTRDSGEPFALDLSKDGASILTHSTQRDTISESYASRVNSLVLTPSFSHVAAARLSHVRSAFLMQYLFGVSVTSETGKED